MRSLTRCTSDSSERSVQRAVKTHPAPVAARSRIVVEAGHVFNVHCIHEIDRLAKSHLSQPPRPFSTSAVTGSKCALSDAGFRLELRPVAVADCPLDESDGGWSAFPDRASKTALTISSITSILTLYLVATCLNRAHSCSLSRAVRARSILV